jgi:hypothetical protein
MASLPAAPGQPQCQSQTIRAGQVQAVPHAVHWLRRPQVAPQGWRHAILAIDGTAYRAECQFAAGESGCVFQVVDLRRLDTGADYRLVIGHGDDTCSCPHATYRGVTCKHISAVQAALAWLEERERLEWEAAVALQALGEADVSVPF